jgi:hypothetical protein
MWLKKAAFGLGDRPDSLITVQPSDNNRPTAKRQLTARQAVLLLNN